MKKLIIGLMAAGLIGGVLAGSGVAQQAPAAPAAPGAPAAAPEGPKYGKKVGDVVAPSVVKDFEGKDVDTAKLMAEKTMFVIVNSVCNLCAAEVASLSEHKDKFTAKAKVAFVVVDPNLDRAKTKYEKFAKEFLLLHDADYKIGESVDLNSTPSTLIVDKGGKILYKGQGFRPDMMKEYLSVL